MFVQPDNWSHSTPDQKLEARIASWKAAPGLQFASPQVQAKYQQEVQTLADAIELKKPDHIPVCPNIGFYPAKYAGISAQEAMYDFGKLGTAWKKFNQDFPADVLTSCSLIGPGKLLETLDYKLYKWPGHGTNPETPYQAVESEYMHADEYDLLIADPSGYWMRKYMPRIFGALAPWGMLSPFTDIVELPFVGAVMIPVGFPDVQKSFEAYIEAGRLGMEYFQRTSEIDNGNRAQFGTPALIAGFSKAPFDTLGDTLRGTRAIMLDKFRQPDKLLAAMERLVPIAIEMGVRTAAANNSPVVFIPLHKGADGFLSVPDFAKFYWPTLKATIVGLIQEGLMPYVFVEGSYNQRLQYLADPEIARGRVLWAFDQTDMREAKRILGDHSCIAGNVPVSLLKTAKPEAVTSYVRDLIEVMGHDGGFILSNGAVLDDAEPENLHAFLDAGKEFGA
jgi:hypothetical protein